MLIFKPNYVGFYYTQAITHTRFFTFPDGNTLMAVYDKGNVYELEEAYDLGIINNEELLLRF
ncbi:MAG TPA: hypothetical protein GXX17_05750 [Clostridiales bacterium]|nr:hypothetical protein [Clostridiales bacterium]